MKNPFPVIVLFLLSIRCCISQELGKPFRLTNLKGAPFHSHTNYGSYPTGRRSQLLSERQPGGFLRGQSARLDTVANGYLAYNEKNYISTKYNLGNGQNRVTTNGEYRKGINGFNNGKNGFQNALNGNVRENGQNGITRNGHRNGNGLTMNGNKNGQNVYNDGNGRKFNFADQQEDGLLVFGNPGVDFPIYADIPQTGFQCSSHIYPGYYADTETRCQVFHICHHNGRRHSFLCPNATIFSQKHFVCAWWSDVNCEDTLEYYSLNEKLYQELEENLQSENTRQYY